MADKFTGFWEAHPPDDAPELMTTIQSLTVDELLERLRVRMTEAPRGTHIRIDLIAWDEI